MHKQPGGDFRGKLGEDFREIRRNHNASPCPRRWPNKQRRPLPFDCLGAGRDHCRGMTPLERAEQDLAEAEQVLLEQMARVQGLKERLRYLRECAEPRSPSETDRTTAIVAVLRPAARRTPSPSPTSSRSSSRPAGRTVTRWLAPRSATC